MNKLIKLAFAAFLVIGLKGVSEATGIAVSPKEIKTFAYSTNVSSVTTFTTLQSTSGVTMPGAVYALYLSTGTAGDYVVLFDSTTAVGNTVNATTITNQVGPRFYFGSTTATTIIRFDPPLLFFTGLMVGMSSAADEIGVEYETGRGLSGQ